MIFHVIQNKFQINQNNKYTTAHHSDKNKRVSWTKLAVTKFKRCRVYLEWNEILVNQSIKTVNIRDLLNPFLVCE